MLNKIKLFLNKISTYFLILLILIFGFKFVFYKNITGLDLSWIYAINYLSATNFYIWGKDVFFTYGPLGYLSMPALIGNNVYIAYIYYSLIFSTLTGSLIYIAKNIKNESCKLGFVLLLFILTVLTYDIYLFVPVLLAVLYLHTNKTKQLRANYVFFSLALIFSAINLFIKTNMGITSLITLFFAFCTVSVENKQINLKQLFLGLGYIISITVLMILLYFKDFPTFLHWLNVSLMIAAGYTEGMTKVKWFNEFFLADALIIIGMLFYIFKKNIENKTTYSNVAVIFLPYLFFQFKSGFVRQDSHMLFFYLATLFILVILLMLGETKTRKEKILSGIIFILAIIFPLIFNNFDLKNNIFSSTHNVLHAGSEKIESTGSNIEPSWIKIIGKDRVEILPYELSRAIKYNLNIQFNPILQLYSVYTDKLDKISAKSFESDSQAPKYILVYDFTSIDHRNMFFDTPATWESIKENYKVLDSKNGRILLKKREKAIKTEFETFKTSQHKFNEEIFVPKGAKKALIKTDLSLIGKITNFAFRLSPTAIYIKDKNNNELRYRQIRSVLKNGLYTDSFATDIYELNNWFENTIPSLQMQSFKLQVKHPIFYSRNIKIEWQK